LGERERERERYTEYGKAVPLQAAYSAKPAERPEDKNTEVSKFCTILERRSDEIIEKII
jgi:hypothetical protein